MNADRRSQQSLFGSRRIAAAIGGMLLSFLLAAAAYADTRAFTIRDDPEMNRIVDEVRTEYLAKQDFSRLNVVILVAQPDGTWKRGSYNPEALAYPASCVKLAYMVAAMQWCREQGRPYAYLDRIVRPMMAVSDNYATGEVVDTITKAPNDPKLTTVNDAFHEWEKKRGYTERMLDARGLLGTQIVRQKTFPTNSGEDPVGAEKLSREYTGMNRMEPRLCASLMLEIAKGAVEPSGKDYMLSLLARPLQDRQSIAGRGFPPGTLLYSKGGAAYDTLEDIVYAVLPNGREVVTAIFTNGWASASPKPHDVSQIGYFYNVLLDRLGLLAGCPPAMTLTAESPEFHASGEWTDGKSTRKQFGKVWKEKAGGDGKGLAEWKINVPENGLYEVSVWAPGGENPAEAAPLTVEHSEGTTTVLVNQRVSPARWTWIGEFPFAPGKGRVFFSDALTTPTQKVAADAIRLIKCPEKPKPQPTGTETAGGTASLEAAVPTPPPPLPPDTFDVIVDNDDGGPAYRETGVWKKSDSLGFQGKTYRFAPAGSKCVATWLASLPKSGMYEVSVMYYPSANRSKRAKYEVRSAKGTFTIYIDQTQKKSAWVSLGIYQFKEGSAAVAMDGLDSAAGTPGESEKVIVADAVMFRWYGTEADFARTLQKGTSAKAPAASSGAAVHVESITPSVQLGAEGEKTARANIVVRDSEGRPVQGVEVVADFIGDIRETVKAMTNSRGIAVVRSTASRTDGVSFSVCIAGLNHPFHPYDASANVKICESYSLQE